MQKHRRGSSGNSKCRQKTQPDKCTLKGETNAQFDTEISWT